MSPNVLYRIERKTPMGTKNERRLVRRVGLKIHASMFPNKRVAAIKIQNNALKKILLPGKLR